MAKREADGIGITEGRERIVQRNCLEQVGRSRGPSGGGEEKRGRQGCGLHSSGGPIHTALSVNGAHGGCKVRSVPTHTGQSCLKRPFSFYLRC